MGNLLKKLLAAVLIVALVFTISVFAATETQVNENKTWNPVPPPIDPVPKLATWNPVPPPIDPEPTLATWNPVPPPIDPVPKVATWNPVPPPIDPKN